MTINLKTTIIASSLLAGALNVVQFSSSVMARKEPPLAQNFTSPTGPSTSPAPVKLALYQKTATPTPSPAALTDPAAQSPAQPPAPPAAPPAPATLTADDTAAKLAKAGLKPDYAALYLSVQARTGTPWQLLAAVHMVETGQSGNTTRKSSAGATGPMQFMPGTFATYAMDGDGNGTKDITDIDDAMLTAGRYLAAGGAAKGNYSGALYNYNHSNAYVSQVMTIAHKLGL